MKSAGASVVHGKENAASWMLWLSHSRLKNFHHERDGDFAHRANRAFDSFADHPVATIISVLENCTYPKKNSTAGSCAVGGKKPVDRRSA
ncbi:MAG: hypothetical protein IPP19_12010 [Verrucomicrobia bacterium]|nr:hypothetical protein [Verrucomicrobiota bacterium]